MQSVQRLNLAELTAANIRTIAAIREGAIGAYPWTRVEQITLTDAERAQAAVISQRLLKADTLLMNEATIWGRAIYPLLILAEQESVQAWAGVPLWARYPHVELQGVADGVMGCGLVSVTETAYYLVVATAKRTHENRDPRVNLMGNLLAAARLNWEHNQQPMQEIFGCYTLADTWKFLRAVVQDIDSPAPSIRLEPSREYVQKFEAETILKILRGIVLTSHRPLANIL